MEKTIIIQSAPLTDFKVSVNFDKDEFEELIQSKGYEVIIEKALKCPCRIKEAGQALSTCQNCGATGWVFINPKKTRMVLHSMNQETRYKEWSEENRGTVSVTARYIDTLAFMDKITVVDAVCDQKGGVFFTQVLQTKEYKGSLFAFTVYEIKEVIELFQFITSDQPLKKLVENIDFTIQGNKIVLDSKFKNTQIDNIQLTIRYKHDPVYHVLDLSREIMNQWITDKVGNQTQASFPVHAVAKRAHYILDASNYNGDRLINNSYDKIC